MIARFNHAVVGVGAVSPLGPGAAALDAVTDPGGEATAVRERELSAGEPTRRAAALCDFPLDPLVPADERAQRLMSVAAKLATIAVHEALRDRDRGRGGDGLALYLGAGSSGDVSDDGAAVVQASLEHGAFSEARFGRRGLRTMHPLRTFVMLTNFTMCHPAMAEGARGPNGVFFSRGSGTALALLEAAFALDERTCDTAIAGGADTATSPLTLLELARDGWLAHGLVPAEGAAALTLRVAPTAPSGVEPPLAYLEAVAVGRRGPLRSGLEAPSSDPRHHDGALDDELAELLPGADLVLQMTCRPDAPALAELCRRAGGARGVELGPRLGDALAAAPALGWAAAVRALALGRARRAVVVSRGVDRTWCAVALTREGPQV